MSAAQAVQVRAGGGTAAGGGVVVVRAGVVEVAAPGRSAARGGAAGLVAGGDERAGARAGLVAQRGGVQELPVAAGGVPDPRAVRGEDAGEVGGDRAVPVELAGGVGEPGESLHGDLDVDDRPDRL